MKPKIHTAAGFNLLMEKKLLYFYFTLKFNGLAKIAVRFGTQNVKGHKQMIQMDMALFSD